MNKKQWFVCLGLPDYDLLIPQNLVDSSSWMGEGSTIGCNGKRFTTTVIPHLEQLSLSECRVFSGQVGACLCRRGIIGVHFEEHRVQYLIDDRFLSIAEEKGDFLL